MGDLIQIAADIAQQVIHFPDMYKLIFATGYFPNLVHGATLGEYESLLFLPL